MDRLDRPIHPEALSPLSELDDYEIAEGSPDIRGWTVRDAAGHEIGEVNDLLIDTASGEALYATVDLDDGGEVDVPLATVLVDEAEETIGLTEPLVTGASRLDPAFETPATAEFADTTVLIEEPSGIEPRPEARAASRPESPPPQSPPIGRAGLDDTDRGEATMERDEAMRSTGPLGDRDMLEDIEAHRDRGAENPGSRTGYRKDKKP